MRILFRYGILAATIGLVACELEVENPNSPATDKVLATPNDVESLLGSYYLRWHGAMYNGINNVWGMANVQSFENYSSLANEGQNARAGIPRPPNDNTVGNVAGSNQQRTYFVHNEVARIASNILAQLSSPGFTLGSAARDLRGKAFAEFLRGVSLGYVALLYDSSAINSQATAGDDAGLLYGYRTVMDSAIAALDRAVVHANAAIAAAGPGNFPLPSTWIPSSTSFTAAEFIRLARSYNARFRANVARTPAERADISAGGMVNWAQVVTEAQNGITADHNNVTNTTTGPYKSWVAAYMGTLGSGGVWHQMSPFVIGMADTTTAYATWAAEPLATRGSTGAFLMVTPDLRFPQGGTRAAQQADFTIGMCSAASTPCKRYFRNRPAANDQFAGLSWGFSNYDHARYYSWFLSGDGTGQNGRIVFFSKAEVNLLEAEGHIRKAAPNYAAAAALINISRTAGMVGGVATGGGLPAIVAFDATSPVPGGAACVPKVPVNARPAGGGTVTCGTMLEAMKYEKRIETVYQHFAAWFFDMRGWGDLAEGTPLHWAPPYQDLQSRRLPLYSTGVGTSGRYAATVGTYGW